ncbi:hypothetical protein PC116_g21641 [Phytophthora cactorum]|nr:hypothetical protein PC116_g21641 [Phytophthora cactorum]
MVGRSAQERQHGVHVDVTWADSTGQPVDVRLVTSEPRDTEDTVEGTAQLNHQKVFRSLEAVELVREED